jgi:trk system potassium uptake protein
MVSPLPVLHLLGPVMVVFGMAMCVPLAVGHALADAGQRAYDLSVVVTMASGALTWVFTRSFKSELHRTQGILLVVLAWTLLPAFAAMPLLAALPNLSFTDAYFEAVSAMSTTGATVIVGLDNLPPSLNVWRCMLQWIGGMGVVVLAVAILPLLGVGGRQLFVAETPGPMKDQKLTPRIRQTAKGLWGVYCAITAACILAFWIGGMSFLDALMHAFSIMSLGGFSSYDASFGYFDSPLLETIAVLFMVVAGINFSTHFSAMSRASLRPYRRDSELFGFLLILFLSCWGLAVFLWLAGSYPDLLTAARFATFNVVSIATTTGLVNTDYSVWPVFAPMWMLGLCCFASCSGSTGGGIKMIRMQLLLLNAKRALLLVTHPRAYAQVKVRESAVPNQVIGGVLVFVLVFAITVIVGTLALTATGLDFVSAFTAVVASVTNTGPGLGVVGPAGNYASLLDIQKWVCIVAMLAGRLEFLTLLVVFLPGFWQR